jgi:Ni/Fe-hydrogenase subunit HybB-like protein
MESNAFIIALRSLKARFKKNVIENRASMILLWAQIGLIFGMFCSILVIRLSAACAIDQIGAHPHQPAAIDIVSLANFWRIVFWVFTIGSTIVSLILSISGILPGTHRRIE